jgi:hypothetical protein
MLKTGIYVAYPLTWNVEEKTSGVLQLAINLEHRQARNIVDGKMVDTDLAEPIRKTGYFCLTKKDGTVNEKVLNGVKNALGWDGDLETLATSDFTQVPVVSVVKPKKDKPDQLEVGFINPIDWKPGGNVTPITAEGAAKLSEKFGSMFRAFKSEPKKKAPPMPSAPPSPPKTKTIDDVYQEAWEVFVAHTAQLADDDRNAKWISLVSDAKAKSLTGEQFAELAAQAGQQANYDDLPF